MRMRIKTSNDSIINVDSVKNSITIEGVEFGSDCRALTSNGIFRLTAVKRIPANTVGVKVSAIGGVQENTLQTGYHLKMPFIDKVYTLSTSVQTKTKEKAMTVFSNYTTLKTVNDSVVSPAVRGK
ncbi:hypothetical protein SMSK564_1294 [Streptococcus mitis SK564]|uniref:Band 7 domain-containing protein n=2 Tax=Streptococcus mitis TaxID=28037 RepID=E1LN25_STRMT|nr:hypothetical protein SMSK564_1294 [Streptococcus mitis SK564]DAK10655.1 MAG TPA: High frequency of lysogenization C protein [Caudoviricetes sp.]